MNHTVSKVGNCEGSTSPDAAWGASGGTTIASDGVESALKLVGGSGGELYVIDGGENSFAITRLDPKGAHDPKVSRVSASGSCLAAIVAQTGELIVVSSDDLGRFSISRLGSAR